MLWQQIVALMCVTAVAVGNGTCFFGFGTMQVAAKCTVVSLELLVLVALRALLAFAAITGITFI
ncbi:MAG: hypothetical protein KBI18_03525 [Brachymonas sp.]|nr:hypothetical protein [Brachymonas sp.]MBP8747719.1 hypothetical protein [Brachymonas sp.]